MYKNKQIQTKYDPIKRFVIKELVKSTGYSYQFIADAAALRRVTEAADAVRNLYEKRYSEVKEVLN
jgi:CheY-like chemotaxis protein